MFLEVWTTLTTLFTSELHATSTLPVMYFVDGVFRFEHIRAGVLLLRLGCNRAYPNFGRPTRVQGGAFHGIPGQGTFDFEALVSKVMPLPAVDLPAIVGQSAPRLAEAVTVAHP